uniref:DDE_Tnp_1_7 domain-containing protein n=1 Tax=Panagrellus redivivus TaxID=6233 RepID=A0A7E4W0X0_PANRE
MDPSLEDPQISDQVDPASDGNNRTLEKDPVGQARTGKTLHLTSLSAVSNHYLFDSNFTTFGSYKFIQRARFGVVSLRGYFRSKEYREPRQVGSANTHWRRFH